jgi:hypothetical protein
MEGVITPYHPHQLQTLLNTLHNENFMVRFVSRVQFQTLGCLNLSSGIRGWQSTPKTIFLMETPLEKIASSGMDIVPAHYANLTKAAPDNL